MTSNFGSALILTIGVVAICTSAYAANEVAPVDQAGRPRIEKLGTIDLDLVETQPIVFRDQLYRFESVRTRYKGNALGKPYFRFVDPANGEATSAFAEGHDLGSALVCSGTMYVFGTPGWGSPAIDVFWSKDLQTWHSKRILGLPGWKLYNCSVCKAGEKYVMAFEVGGPPEVVGRGFTSRFAESNDLLHWQLLDEPAVFTKERYSACPTIRHEDGWFYVVYLESMGNHQYNPAIVRSRDLANWESSPLNPLMQFDEADKRIANPRLTDSQQQTIAKALNRNNSDVDFCQHDGRVIINYSWGDQAGHEFLAEAFYVGTLKKLLTDFFPQSSDRLEETSAQRTLGDKPSNDSAIAVVLDAKGEPTPASVSERPHADDSGARRPVTLYVSKLGDNTDGSSWQKAFHTIQAALSAVPDDKGGHRVFVRPDTYMEANMLPAHRGAKDAYNELIGDFDGSLGSGTTGHVVLDAGDPSKGFKSYDWWGNIRAYQKGWSDEHTQETVSAIKWDRWVLRRLYATGGDGGLCFDCTNRIEPFTVVVEDCISLGRAFGCGAMSCLSRSDEPITFRRCNMWSLDEWGDTAAGYVRIENKSMPKYHDIVFEDCTMVSPQCALKGGNYGFHTYTHALVKNCTLVALNFSQPQGTPTDGVVQSVQNGKYFHVDFENCVLMGFKVFGVKVDKDSAGGIGYSTKGSALAYVQYTQQAPKGFHALDRWPVEVFSAIAPPAPAKPTPVLTHRELVLRDMCEVSPFLWKGRLCLMECYRPSRGGVKEDYYLLLRDVKTGDEMARFAVGYGLASCHVKDGVFYAFASRFEEDNWNDVTLFKSHDLKTWKQKVVVKQENEHLFNSSVCEGPDGFVLAYESNDRTYPGFTTKFARSDDLDSWFKLPDAAFGTNRYTACPTVRYVNGYYYVLYLEHRRPSHVFETYLNRSKDLKTWELSGANPVIAPTGLDEGVNASDPEVVEFGGKTFVYFAVGDQLTWMNVKRGEFDGTLQQFYERWYAQPGIRDSGDMASERVRATAKAKTQK